MRCPQCKIHYDDNDRACPMCGARKPIGQPAAASQKPKPPTGRTDTAAPSSAPPRTNTYRDAPAPAPISADKRKKRSPLGTVILVFMLLQLLPLLFSGLHDVIRTIPEGEYFFDTPPAQEDHWLPEPDFQETDFPYAGIWQDESLHEIALGQTPDPNGDRRYQITLPEITEYGYYFAFPCTGDEGWVFPEAYPEEAFMWWMVQLSPDRWTAGNEIPPVYSHPDGYGTMGGAVSIFQSRENPEEIYLINSFDEIPWLAPDALYAVTRIGSGEDADARTMQPEPTEVHPSPDENPILLAAKASGLAA